MGRTALGREDGLAVVYEAAFRRAGRWFAARFSSEVVTAAGWVPPEGGTDLDADRLLEAARVERELAALEIEETLAERVRDMGISFDPEKFKVFSPDLLASLGAHAGANFDSAARESLGSVVSESFDKGLSVPDTAKAIRGRFDHVSKSASVMLARTDLISLANGGSYMAARQVFERGTADKVWLNAHDARVRPSHASAGGQTVPLDKPFSIGGFELMYPGDPQGPPAEVINCRCTFTVEEGKPKRVGMSAPKHDGFAAPPKGEMAQQIFGEAKDTEALFSTSPGVYSGTAREAVVHRPMVAHFLRAGVRVPEGQQPQTMFLAGGSGVGKTTVRKSLTKAEKPYRPVTADADGVKELFDEFKRMAEVHDPYAAFGVHEESSSVAKSILQRANEGRKNLIVDGTGDAGPGKFLDKIREAQALGRKVNVVLVDVDVEQAILRVNKRAGETGRHIAEATVRDLHQQVSVRFREWRDATDWKLYATDGPKGVKPRLVAERVNNRDAIYDEIRFEKFLDKAYA